MVAIAVALDSRLAELGAQRFGRALADVNRVAASTGLEVDRLNSRMTRGADAFARFTAAVASTSAESGELGRVIQAGGVPWLLNAGGGGAPTGPAGPAGSVGGAVDWLDRNLGAVIRRLYFIENLRTSTLDAMSAREQIESVDPPPLYPGLVESELHGVAHSTGTYFPDVAALYGEMGRSTGTGFEAAQSLAPQLIEDLLNLNRLNGLSGDDLIREVERFMIRSDGGLANSAETFRRLIAGIEERDEGLWEDLSAIATDMLDDDYGLADLAGDLSDERERINGLADAEQPGFWPWVGEQWNRFDNTVQRNITGPLGRGVDAVLDAFGPAEEPLPRQVPGPESRRMPDQLQPQFAHAAGAEAQDLQRLVDARREEQIHLKRLEERRQAVAAAGAVEIAVINDQAMAIENLAMVNAGGAVSALANADAVLMQTEAYRAQAETVEGSFTPATKGAAEATMELADAAVGLDAALKAPDPAAMAKDMEELSALGQQVGNSFASAFERAVLSGEELSDVLSALALDLARLVLQQQVLGPLAGGIGGLFDDIIGGLFGITGVGSSVGGVTQSASTGHRGGIAGSLPSYARGFSPTVWLGASRYHFGGLAGDEVPAILRRGEEVLTRDDPRHRANGGMAGGGVTIHQTISIDAKAVNENGVDGVAADAVGRQMRAAVRSAVQAEIAQQSRVGGMLNRV